MRAQRTVMLFSTSVCREFDGPHVRSRFSQAQLVAHRQAAVAERALAHADACASLHARGGSAAATQPVTRIISLFQGRSFG